MASSCPNCGHHFPPCPYCAKALPTGTERCPWCGNSLNNQSQPKPPQKPLDPKSKLGWGIVIALVLLVSAVSSKCDGNHTPPPASPSTPTKPVAVVSNSSWDGSVYQVEQWLKHNLKDPDSFQAIEWSPVVEIPPGSKLPHKFIARCKYRAKNSFGGYAIEQKMFYLDSEGRVVNVKDYPLK